MSKDTRLKKIVSGADQLSLGISIVVAIALGVGLGLWLKSLTSWSFMLWFGLALGIAAAILNVYKAYKIQIRSLDELKDEKRYKPINDEDNE
ncbi:AtpZ/AtpI family protein [Campylobacter sp. faydin G-24]|uniref:AtpZ/AtpI family protein n=1 Tax=Campylobacter anatolicus TaxID=2829105 RepID=A0ABS5HJD0_9BACT|nr:AtpZ/AtpI family protein [Campylobacter anatolicus]MBR8461969.1 AtpZ/AtpI family protein [Campylobacter anatolicus]MBR8464366.1 AtpZ/AtpI family protein [Campylobacter anatolicus]MBR8464942.1 AtpZ/AtpI family protein [Campylobacter anatolicus]